MMRQSQRLFSKSALMVLACFMAACSRPLGDFNRPAQSFLHDSASPFVGKQFAKLRKEPVSFFRRTDDEKRLVNVVEDISRPLHVNDWLSGSLIEGERTRIFPNINYKLDYRAYLFWLRREPFLSSETRWSRVISDIKADQGLVTPFYAQARLIHTVDKERSVYLRENPDLDLKYRLATTARHEENRALFQKALDSFVFRYKAYEHAIKHLIVETPSPRAQIALDELEKYKRLIEAGGELDLTFLKNDVERSSRIKFEDKKLEDDKVPQK